MSESIYRKLQNDFAALQVLYMEEHCDEVQENRIIEHIGKTRMKISQKSYVEGKRLILYCIDTLFELMKERDGEKLLDFTTTICNMPEICLGMRNVYSFHNEITAFQKKYGKDYFSFYKEAKPEFRRKAPRNAVEYFSPASDVSFKELHPVGYVLLTVVGMHTLVPTAFTKCG